MAGDTLLHVHRLWFVPRMLASGQVPYGWTDLIHFPDGTSQYLETLIPLLGVLSWPAQALGGPILAYDFAVLLVLSALALILVGRWAPVLPAADVLPATDREEAARGSST